MISLILLYTFKNQNIHSFVHVLVFINQIQEKMFAHSSICNFSTFFCSCSFKIDLMI